MRNYLILGVIGLSFLLSGCSLSRYGGQSTIESEQHENPEIWMEMYKVQDKLLPLVEKVNEAGKKVQGIEDNVNKMKDELATTKLSAIQAIHDIASMQLELRQMSDTIRTLKTSVDLIRAAEIKNEKEMPRMEKTKAASESKKANLDIKSKTINDIQYHKVSATEDKVLIYVNALNNPKLQRLEGENPRLVLDFFNARNLDKERHEIKAEGNFIKRIRISSDKEPIQRVRIVLDMMPKRLYSVEQKFLKNENVYSLTIKAK